MSGWFDTTKGLATFAKTALSVAQKQIDKALDINASDGPGDGEQQQLNESTVTAAPENLDSKTVEAEAAANWGSFTGSFFENPKAHEMITTPPTTNQTLKHNEMINAEEKVCKDLHLADLSNSQLPESLVIIAGNEAADDDEEQDAISMKTVMDCDIGQTPTAAMEDFLQLSSMEANTTQESAGNSSSSTLKLLVSMEEVPSETRTVDTDSSHSFEDIQMHSSMDMQLLSQNPLLCLSEDNKMELLKSASMNSSPQLSNDDIDTTTSSDIEIISNPNGDSSSTNSATRASPLKLKKNSTTSPPVICGNTPHSSGSNSLSFRKGHCREPSEISILSETECIQAEMDKLMLRLTEQNEILEAREMRLLQSEQENAALQQVCSELQAALNTVQVSSLDATAEEYTHRLSSLEKKFQSSIRERDALKIQLKTLKEELDGKMVKDNLCQEVQEKNDIIKELQLEGEKLSKEILQQSNIIKKLRVKEKTSDATLKKNKEQIATLTDETERLKKTLTVKEDVERTQIEAVNKMSSEKRKLDEENQKYQNRIEDLETKLQALQISFEAAKVELQQRQNLHSDLTRSTEQAQTAQKEKEASKAENQELRQQLQNTLQRLRICEQTMSQNEQQLRENNKELMKRLEFAEQRAEMSTQEVSLTTIPLMRQLESLQQQLNQKSSTWNKEEKDLLQKLALSESRLKSLANIEATSITKQELLQSRCVSLEEKLSLSVVEEEKCKIKLHQLEMESNLKESNLSRQLSELQQQFEQEKSKISQLEEELKKAKEASYSPKTTEGPQLTTTKTISDSLLRRNLSVEMNQPSHSPPQSCGVNSLEEAMGGSVDWQADDFETVSNSGRQTGHSGNLLYGLARGFMGGHNTTTLEHLQALLKQRDGELANLQWEMSRLQAERTVLNEEISELTLELENLKEKLQPMELLEVNYADLQNRYDALLQMYGEKVERTEELELDLKELKEAYKIQIDELLAQPQKTK